MFRLPKSVRTIRRVQIIARVLTQHGFGHLVDSLHLERYVPLPKRWQQAVLPSLEGEPEASIGRRIARVCEELGPTFVKLGQILSSRPDLVSSDIIAELVKLQDRVPPFPTDQARRIIEADLGMPISQCFTGFSDEPFASGSIAQVYRATTVAAVERPACSVVVKVKRPGIEDTIRLDMTILRWIGDVAERLVPELAVYHPKMIVDEFEQTMMRELDFVNEAATIARFAESIGEDPNFRVPTVFWDLTGTSVLTLEEMHGVSVQTLLSQPDPAVDRKQLADRLARGFVKQFFETGLFHADPHPGNLLVEPPAAIRLIDFGLTGRIDDEMLGHLVMALIGAVNHEPEIVVEVLADMDALGEQTDRAQLQRDFFELIEKYYGLPLHRFDMQTLFHEITGLIRRNDVSLPREFVLFGKALVAVGGICLQLDPDMDLLTLVKPRLVKLLAERVAPARLLKSAAMSGWHLLNFLKGFPSQLRDVSRRMARGKWQVNIRHQNLDFLANEIDRASNRLSFAVITAAIIIGSSWILASSSATAVLGVPTWSLGVIGYVLAGLMGLWLVIAIVRSGKLS
ncbi:MAG: AarF/ABC1/UbiB kinase family protein [Phycisphaerae bacterium]|nr:AarF/ABC1/UbiB kinase family protein [Phycisphaerae bacterium]